jgi:CheY-like chemotaxis protein
MIEGPLTILIVDDITMNRSMLRRRLEKNIAPNCIVSEAKNGEEALALCSKQTFHVIIVDQFMEEAGGVLLGTDTIIAMRRSMVRSLVVGYSGNDVDDKFKTAGADIVWTKPMPSNAELLKQLRHGLSQRGLTVPNLVENTLLAI